MARGDAEWVRDMITAIADIRADTAGMDFSTFSGHPVIVRSVLYSIAIIGEAATNISPEFKKTCPDIPWRPLAGIRDRIVHEYFRTNTRRIWDVVADDIDALEAALRDQPNRSARRHDLNAYFRDKGPERFAVVAPTCDLTRAQS